MVNETMQPCKHKINYLFYSLDSILEIRAYINAELYMCIAATIVETLAMYCSNNLYLLYMSTHMSISLCICRRMLKCLKPVHIY